MSLKGKALIVGAYEHPTRDASDTTLAQRHAHRAAGAPADARLTLADVDGDFCSGDVPGGEAPGSGPFSRVGYFDLNRCHPNTRKGWGSAHPILGSELEFWDISDAPMRISDKTLLRQVDLNRTSQPAFVLRRSAQDRDNVDHPLAMHVTQEARVIAQAEGHNPGQQILGAPPVCVFDPHQPEQCCWEPHTFLDITDGQDTKRRADDCMAGQDHRWHCDTHVAQQRGVQVKRNIGITAARNIEYAEGFMRLTPCVVETL